MHIFQNVQKSKDFLSFRLDLDVIFLISHLMQ